jgi:hexokinase
MSDLKEKVKSFFSKYGMDAANVDFEQNCQTFANEMQSGLDGSSSLLMIPTYIGVEKELPLNEPVIAIDAGGTNFRVAVIHFDENSKVVIEDFQNYSMPGTKGEISKDEFFETMADYIIPVLHRSSKISFCFSYPVEILPNRDGRLIRFTKEVKVRDVEGENLGESLMKVFRKRGCTEQKSIIVLNDTVATLLAGKASSPGRVFDSYIGFILGTGTNICYAEKCSNIGKVPELRNNDGTMLINMESGGYSKAPRGVMDLELDRTTVNPGDYAFEKAISGAYQGALIYTVLKKAICDGIITSKFASAFERIQSLASKEIDDFLFWPFGSNTLAVCCNASGNEEDRTVLYHLIDGVLERAAKYVAFSLTAVLEKTGKGRNPCAPACITADGSTFYKSKLFRTKLDHYIKTYTNEAKGIYCEFAKVDNGTLIGTAIAGLLN